jgi:hypothetical protein
MYRTKPCFDCEMPGAAPLAVIGPGAAHIPDVGRPGYPIWGL